jgi:uncharacterized protein (TIGR00290 family)
MKAYMNWSGGKDSSLALYKILTEQKLEVRYLFTSINKTYDRISMHGVRRSLLEQQASSIGIPLKTLELSEQPNMEEYETKMQAAVNEFRNKGIGHTIFGDIFLEDLKTYREEKLNPLSITTHFPLWKIPSADIMHDFFNLGFKAIVVCVNGNYLDSSFCGRLLDADFIRDLPQGIDVCGENGEYHSFVYDGPIFDTPIHFTKGEIVHRQYKTPASSDNEVCKSTKEDKGFYFCDLY